MNDVLWEGGLLAIAGLGAGFINTVAGGGSLLTLLALMLVGLPAPLANGTNRIAVLAQSFTATMRFYRSGYLSSKHVLPLALGLLVGASLGALVASMTSPLIIEWILLATMVLLAGVFFAQPALFDPESPPENRPARSWRDWGALVLAGFYGGFIQAGVGFLLLWVLVSRLHLSVVEATALKVALVLPYTVTALVIFSTADQVAWEHGLALGVGAVAGAAFGVRVSLDHTAWLRGCVLTAVWTSVAFLIFDRLR